MFVLVADDEPELRRVVARMLSSLGHRAETVGDGAELVRRAQAGEPDAVVSDVGMPGEDGLRAAARLKRARPALRLVIMTGDPEAAALARAAGLGPVLMKPFALEELAAVLASF